ncbi:MAG: diadenylate cyclase CdaA [Candidatus Margulisbacteria bacterium]|nr:diadenylate cyclase CdaA [Candidatus Margulisiibacteriota bacterium]
MNWKILANTVDIILVAVMFYYLLMWLRGTRAIALLRGLVLILVVYFVARVTGLNTINWLFDKFTAVVLIIIVIVFQPELRRTLEQLGRGRIFTRLGVMPPPSSWFIRSLVRAVEQLADSKTGALIVLERNTGLNEYVESGVRLDAAMSTELLVSIFQHKSYLHDGAVVVQADRILAAGCLLPLSESRLLDKRLGTRHRAAVGISELTDAIVIVISEQTGTISFAENGYLTRFVTKEMLEEKLFGMYRDQYPKFDIKIPWKKKKKSQKST